MAITVRFPAMLHGIAGREVVIDEPADDVASVLMALERKFPGIGQQLADPIYNLAINDEMLLHGVRQHPLRDGDIVEVVPTISGGSAALEGRDQLKSLRATLRRKERPAQGL